MPNTIPIRVLIATDAWHPQVNGVVNTYSHLAQEASAAGLHLDFITPREFSSIPMPTYSEIQLAWVRPSAIAKRVKSARPDYIHIATEGPIGLATRRYCLRSRIGFTTSYHTRFPEYVAARFPIPLSWGYRFERWFHNAGIGVMAASKSMCEELASHGIRNAMLWSRGVDLDLFYPRSANMFPVTKPIFLYVGRVAVEKNIDAFLALDLPGTKVVVGGGPQLDGLRTRHPDVHFTGPKFGADLAAAYASADVFVFPSRTDTFGNVILEALACGVPTAGFPVTGPKDIVIDEVGAVNEDLGAAALTALTKSRDACRAYASTFSWAACARRFREIIEQAHAKAHALSPVP